MEDRSHIVLVHGAGGGPWEWDIWARVLEAAGIRVHRPGLQPAAPGLAATRLDDYRQQLAAAIARAGPAPVLVGASLGGRLAAECAERAAALVLVNPLLPERPAAGPGAAAIRAWRGRAALAGTRRALPDADAAAALHAFRRWRDESAAVLEEARATPFPPRPACPCLLVLSEADRDVAPAATRALAADWAVETIALAGASHVGPLLGREAAAVAARVLAWLDRGWTPAVG
ncbi:alpha/beta hydrolase [Coralloluteibacterium stylophorae]|uniref:Alpha/beta hydrolase n=1 Tax=Coralloluteibacterium stylophorae TaxID=1776034 RepID=A0A8J7VU04_9GAMM|nr:alpha/beta hydrolase [Coralloluteibacterium stylophorae]MBS7456703.1 alpha/beta hydrolase [Coralloluteibacterium stylophorae]